MDSEHRSFRDRWYDWLGAKPRPWIGWVMLGVVIAFIVVLLLSWIFVFHGRGRWEQ